MPKKKSQNSKKASKEERAARKQAKETADNVHKQMGNTVGGHSKMILPSESQHLLAKLAPGCLLSPAEGTAVVRKLALLAGTDVEMNDEDLYGDGDQSPVTAGAGDEWNDIMARMAAMGSSLSKSDEGEPARQIIREVFSAGGDLEPYLKFRGFSPFAASCCMGDSRAVEKAIKGTAEGSVERMHLLERRESGMRFSPLLLAIAISKVKSYVCQITGAREADMDHVNVVKVLLRYGARPDCKELTGKSAAHYGAGSRATVDSLKMTDCIVEAAKSCAYFGKRVTLRNLKSVEYNGSTSVLGGYDAGTGRRQVTLDTKKQLSLLPKNIFSAGEDTEVCIYDPSKNLLNECDRVGTISLHEVFVSPVGRVDVAEFLVERNVSVDIEPPCGNSVRKLVYMATPFGASRMHDVIRKHIVTIEKAEHGRCQGCGHVAEKKLSQCARCKKYLYCSRQCQKQHWPIHKAECQDLDQNYSIQLTKPHTEYQLQINGEYKRPDGVGVDELFWTKVQCNLRPNLPGAGPHLVYDKSRSCKFSVMPGTSGHLELFDKIKEEKAFSGTKLYFKAAFDGSGNCRVYPNISSTTKKW